MEGSLEKFLDRLSVVIGALLFIQTPLFISQYRGQLIGHFNELLLQIGAIRQAAESSNKTLEQWIDKFVKSSDPDFSRQGALMQEMVNRGQALSESILSLDNASIFSKPWLFLQHLDYAIFKSTLSSFQMGIPFTYEGFCYLLLGMLFGYFTYQGLRKIANTLFSIAFKRSAV